MKAGITIDIQRMIATNTNKFDDLDEIDRLLEKNIT